MLDLSVIGSPRSMRSVFRGGQNFLFGAKPRNSKVKKLLRKFGQLNYFPKNFHFPCDVENIHEIIIIKIKLLSKNWQFLFC